MRSNRLTSSSWLPAEQQEAAAGHHGHLRGKVLQHAALQLVGSDSDLGTRRGP